MGGEDYFLTYRPEISEISPRWNESDVATNSPIKMTFSKIVDKNSIENNIVILTEENQELFIKNDFTFKWNDNSTKVTMTLKDEKEFQSNKQYKVTFKAPFKDSRGISSAPIDITKDTDLDGPFRVIYSFTNYSKFVTK